MKTVLSYEAFNTQTQEKKKEPFMKPFLAPLVRWEMRNPEPEPERTLNPKTLGSRVFFKKSLENKLQAETGGAPESSNRGCADAFGRSHDAPGASRRTLIWLRDFGV